MMRRVLTGLLMIASLAGSARGAATGDNPHERLFERLKRLEGSWRGKSTKGWTEQVTYRVIAGGSVVMVTSFDAHPNETMVTMFSLDRGRVILTHYCVAKNQPRLLASAFSSDQQTVTFEFHDATGIASRDTGHMDRAVLHFIDDDHYTEQWTWYQKGAERWMEKIELERIDSN